MPQRRTLALSLTGAIVALALICAGTALAAGTSVSVRVEGLKRTLLPATTVRTHSGSVQKGGAPSGACQASTAAGALDVATKNKWNGTYSASSGLGIEITQILGERHVYSPHGYYWSIFVDNRFATAGICGLKLHTGEQLLFAPAPAKGSISALVLKAPRTATAGKAFKVKAFYYPGAGNATKPVAGVTFTGASGTTNKQGIATLTAKQTGTLRLTGSAKGYVRSALATIKVAS
jgi:hypothetical protein